MKYLLALVLLAFSLACGAAIYMQTDSNGTATYSDTPEEHAKAITLPATNNNVSLPQATTAPTSSPGLAATPNETAPGGPAAAGKGYSNFVMTNPVDQQTFQNQPVIPVTVQVNPPLKQGDKIQLYVDSSPTGDATADLTQLTLTQVERGEHQLYAAIIDSNGQTVEQTDSITIFIHYSALTTGSGGITPVSSGGGAMPSSPGTGIVPSGSGITPSGSGVVPPASSGSGTVPPASGGSGITPPAAYGSGIVPGR